jgi:hypothetical protein
MAVMTRIISVAVLALGLSLLAVFGCENQSQKWYGDWVGNLNRVDEVDDVARSINHIKLTIKPDGTFQLLRSGIGDSGSHQLGEDKAFLKITHHLDRPIQQMGPGAEKMNKDLILRWQDDGSITFEDPGGFDVGPVRLTRQQPDP